MSRRYQLVRIDAEGRMTAFGRERWTRKHQARLRAATMTRASRLAGTDITYLAVPEVDPEPVSGPR